MMCQIHYFDGVKMFPTDLFMLVGPTIWSSWLSHIFEQAGLWEPTICSSLAFVTRYYEPFGHMTEFATTLVDSEAITLSAKQHVQNSQDWQYWSGVWLKKFHKHP